MKKFRIVKETSSGCHKNAKYYIQKRYRFLFIPYWDYVRDRDFGLGMGFGDAVWFWHIEEAKKFIEGYREGESKVVYEE